jgi:hypothetical protein
MVTLNEEVEKTYDIYLKRLYNEWNKSNAGDFITFIEETEFYNKKLVEFMESLDFSMDPLILEFGAGSKDSLCEHMDNKKEVYLASPFVVSKDCLNAGIVNCANADIRSDANWRNFYLSLANDNVRGYIKNGVNEHLRPKTELAIPMTYVFPNIENFKTLIASGVGSIFLDTRFGIINYANMICSAIKNNQNYFMGYCGDKDSNLTKKALEIYKSIREDIIMRTGKEVRVETASNIGMAYCYIMKNVYDK